MFSSAPRLGASSIPAALALAMLTPAASAAPVCTAKDGTRTCTFQVTKTYEDWTVPAHITSGGMTVTVRGGTGGRSGLLRETAGGRGNVITGTVAVSPGKTFVVGVGERGEDRGALGDIPVGETRGGDGGWPNGGPSGDRTGAFQNAVASAGGGGGISIFGTRGAATEIIPIIAAAAGGGAGGHSTFIGNPFKKGGAGGDARADGTAGEGYPGEMTGGQGGAAPDAAAGGKGGVNGTFPGAPCVSIVTATSGGDGGAAVGGLGGHGHSGSVASGGGGGGGVFGGGGGGGGVVCKNYKGGASDAGTGGGGGGGGASAVDGTRVSDPVVGLGSVDTDGLVRVEYAVADTEAPQTTITSRPEDTVTSGTATFEFAAVDSGTGSEGLGGYECRVDSGQYEPCTSPQTYTGLGHGSHAFAVRARDAVGNLEPEAATAAWAVDLTAAFADCTSSEDAHTCRYHDGPAVPYQSFRVPDGVTRLTVAATGGAGGQSSANIAGGPGGRATGHLEVTPGEILRITVGPLGAAGFGAGCGQPNSAGGGRAVCPEDWFFPVGGAGGGGSDVRRTPYGLADRLVVGGGGGGASSGATGGAGGHPGHAGEGEGAGGGGTDAAGGAGGASTGQFCRQPGDSGVLGAGGASSSCVDGHLGGGGGGGLYGGGGGGTTGPAGKGGPGGGGSSHVDADALSARYADGVNTGAGRVDISWRTEKVAPTVTLAVASGQEEPVLAAPVSFTARFSELIVDFTGDDVELTGGGAQTAATVTEVAPFDGTTYRIDVSGMTRTGLIIASIPANAVEDLAGNANPASGEADISFVATDTTAPETRITAGPDDPSASAQPEVAFEGTDDADGSGIRRLECRLDDAVAYTTCTSPVSLPGLSDGKHAFRVRAVDRYGNVDATPAEHVWVVDTTAPTTMLTSGPPNPSADATPTFEFAGEDTGGSGVDRIECRLDDAVAYTTCTSPRTLAAQTDGVHTYQVRAVDRAGNVDASPDGYTWRVDTTGPTTQITTGPDSLTTSTSASVSFDGDDPDGSGVDSFECQFDEAAVYTPCESPASLTGLADGVHTFRVRAVDEAGNPDETPGAHTWRVDTTAPQLAPAVTPSPLWLGASGTAAPNASDPDGSGIRSAKCDPVVTTTVGARAVTCTATDRAGNTASVAHHYLVEYRVLGFYDPAPGSKWKVGQTVPVKIALADAAGILVSDSTAGALAAACNVTFTATGAQPTSQAQCMKYDPSLRRFVFLWKLAKAPTGAAQIAVRVAYGVGLQGAPLSRTITITKQTGARGR